MAFQYNGHAFMNMGNRAISDNSLDCAGSNVQKAIMSPNTGEKERFTVRQMSKKRVLPAINRFFPFIISRCRYQTPFALKGLTEGYYLMSSLGTGIEQQIFWNFLCPGTEPATNGHPELKSNHPIDREIPHPG